jgi:hypothetical protein
LRIERNRAQTVIGKAENRPSGKMSEMIKQKKMLVGKTANKIQESPALSIRFGKRKDSTRVLIWLTNKHAHKQTLARHTSAFLKRAVPHT